MAKRVKKPTDEFPPIRGIIQKGAIHPAFAYDAERLDSYRENTNVLVWFAPDGDRPLVRRWWATIGNYLKHTTLPWRDKETASAAIKLALALVEPFKTPSGQWSQYPRSLVDIDDEDLLNSIREMEQLLFQLTGVDVDTLRREAKAEFGDENFQPARLADNDAGTAEPVASPSGSANHSPDEIPPSSGESVTDSPVGDASIGAGDPQNSQAAGLDATHSDEATNQAMVLEAETDSDGDPASNSASIAPNSAGDSDGAVAPADSSSASLITATAGAAAPELSAEDRAWLKLGALWMLAALPDKDPEALRVLIVQINEIRKVMPKDVSRDTLQRMESLRLHCRNVCDGREKLDPQFMATTAMATVAEITPKPVKIGRGVR